MRTAVVAGATGLVGGHLLQELLRETRYTTVIALSRQALGIAHPKLRTITTDFASLEQHRQEISGDDIFCCLGTTIGQAGSKAAFIKVDLDYPLLLAQMAKENGARQYLMVSAVGADVRSSIFYNRVKGEAEAAIRQVGFEGLHILRPSLLIGTRRKSRPTEEAAKIVYKFLNFIIPLKYKGIESGTVARAMVKLALENNRGEFVHESSALQAF